MRAKHNIGRSRTSGGPARAAKALLAGLIPALAGCTETDSFLFDPSVIGRWEHTPTRVPILSRLASIEGPEDEFLEFSDPTPGDLVPEVSEYRIGPGDILRITVFDIPEEGKSTDYDRPVDPRGFVEIPQLGQVYVNGMTSKEAADAVKAAMRDLIGDPLAFVVVGSQRLLRYSIFGAVQEPGQYQIPTADFHLLEALTAAKGFSEAADSIYVIRQVPLTEATRGRPNAPAPRPGGPDMPPQPPGDKLVDIINQLQGQPAPTGATGPTGQPPPPPPPPGTQPPPAPTGGRPPLDLITPGRPTETVTPGAPVQPPPSTTEGTWVNIQGRWVKVRQPEAPPAGAGGPPGVRAPQPAVAQRVIRLPMSRVAMGDARYNIVVRPGDVIRVPPQPSGLIFLSGQVARVGTYNMSERLTLTRAITSAGGLSQIAVPERVDIVRMTGPDQQGFVRVNLRAIEEGTHPDVFLRANDRVNVGTNFWATPLAVIRNGFRASYGFGFIVDRNFGNDIFGAPPANAIGQ